MATRQKKARAGSAPKSAKPKAPRGQMSITKRYINSKRHAVAYLVGGKRRSIEETALLAREGKLRNARLVGRHVQSVPGGTPLKELPQVLVKE